MLNADKIVCRVVQTGVYSDHFVRLKLLVISWSISLIELRNACLGLEVDKLTSEG